MVQTALPSATVSNDWTVTGASAHVAMQVKDEDTGKITSTTQGDACRVNVDSLTDPEGNTGHICHINAQATGSGAPERIELKLFEGSTERAASGNIAITRSSYNDFSFTLSAAEADAITAYTDLRLDIVAAVLGSETLDVSYVAFEVPEPPVAASVLSSPINTSCMI